MFSVSPLRRGEVYGTVPNWLAEYELSRLLYVPTTPVLVYCREMYRSGEIDRDRVIAISKMEHKFMCLA